MDQQHDGDLKDMDVHDSQTDQDPRKIPERQRLSSKGKEIQTDLDPRKRPEGDFRPRRGDSDTKTHPVEDDPKGRNENNRGNISSYKRSVGRKSGLVQGQYGRSSAETKRRTQS